MDTEDLCNNLDHDEAYRVVRVLADKPSGKTELVKGEAPDLLVRKYIPDELANKRAWYELKNIKSALVPQVRDLYQLPDTFVAVTTYVEGTALSELVGSIGRISPRDAASYLLDLCDATMVLHEHGIVHRDITPGNAVIVQGHARLIDLGNARAYVEGAEHDTTRIGTWGFAAPEQFGFAQTDARSDVYSLGSLLGYLLTGVLPSDEAFERALADENCVPFEMRVVIERARAFEPSARYRDSDELAVAIQAALGRAVTASRAQRAWDGSTAADQRGWATGSTQKATVNAGAGKAFVSEEPSASQQRSASAPARQGDDANQANGLKRDPIMRVVRWFFPAPLASRRTWSELRHLEKAFIVALWAAVVVILPPMSVGFFTAGNGEGWGMEASSHLMALVLSPTFVLLAREIHLLVTYLGPGRNVTEGIMRFAVRVIVLCLFSLLLLVAIVYFFFTLEKVFGLA